jgi:hypothetical protein
MDVTFALLMVGSIYLAGRIAERRGRRFIVWAWIAAIIGPLALPLVFLFPNLRDNNGNHPNGPKGEKRPADVFGARRHGRRTRADVPPTPLKLGNTGVSF